VIFFGIHEACPGLCPGAASAVLRDLTAELRRRQSEVGDSDELARSLLAKDLTELKK
jgi:hypothetical protein